MSETDEFEYEKYDDSGEHDVGPSYASRSELKPWQLASSLKKLELFGSDPFLCVQASHIDIVDQFLLDLEQTVLRKQFDEERTPPETHFLAAQSSMWIFAAYELLRTWRQRATDFIKLDDNSGFANKLASMKSKDFGYDHLGMTMRIQQLQQAMDDPAVLPRLRRHVALVHQPFKMLEFLRVSIAKHEVSKSNAVALFPGHGMINRECGSLDFELENGVYILTNMSRRNVSDSIRYLDLEAAVPSKEANVQFEAWLSGKGFEAPRFP